MPLSTRARTRLFPLLDMDLIVALIEAAMPMTVSAADSGAARLAVVSEAIIVPVNTLGTVDYKLAAEYTVLA